MRRNAHVRFGGGLLEKEPKGHLVSSLPYFKAAVLGVDELLAYFLDEADAAACLVCKLPPGKGLDWGQRNRR